MSGVVKALGLGSKGSLNVIFHSSHFLAGELLLGTVVLNVTEPLDVTSLVLRIDGKEMLTWIQGGGEASRMYLREHVHLDEEFILSSGQQFIQPGQYVYPISFRLLDTLPNSFHVSNRTAGIMSHIDASLKYSATAIMTVKGKLSADMEATSSFVVHQQSLCQPVLSLEDLAMIDVQMLGLMKKGTCSLSAHLPSNVYVSGDLLLAQTKVHNNSSKDMNKMTMMLCEDISVDLEASKPKSKGSVCLAHQDFPGVKAGKILEQTLHLPLIAKSSPLPVAVKSHFLTTKYRLVIKCKYRLCRSVSVDFPIEILRKIPGYVSTDLVVPAVTTTTDIPSDAHVEVVDLVAPSMRKSIMDEKSPSLLRRRGNVKSMDC
ncbi:hypothetical protein PsorP6_003456 [Peronosclerospora sorghi]|uniref:Uncharacterized protein n=1 Tax=Peronosclerospora sorghi TaxID=230839 RepID=A0ACC0VNC9_9STRA|nr:hypothetical protein PsorP6_003456 [Peronosclerospora sorghi]